MQNTTEHIISDIFNREISFEYFESLYILTCIPILIILILIYIQWQKKNLLRFSSKNLQESLSDNNSIIRRNIKYILKVLSIFFLIIAISNPRELKEEEEDKNPEEINIKNNENINSKGIEIMIALDISTSMLCEDIKPNRISRSTQFISDLINNLKNHKIGLVIFAGESYTSVPITTDHSFIKQILNNISTDMIGTQGTNISNALLECVDGFDLNNNMNKCIIIISDGESHEEESLGTALKIVEETNTFIHTISVGTEQGGPIPILGRNQKKSYKKDTEGNTIITKPDIESLSLISKTGNGIHVTLGRNNITHLISQVNKIQKAKHIKPININDKIDKEEKNYRNFYPYFLLISFISIFLDFLVLSTNTGLLNKLIQK